MLCLLSSNNMAATNLMNSEQNVTPEIIVQRIGVEQQPVVIIDDFSSRFGELLELAFGRSYQPGGNHYPGHRAPAPPSYLGERGDVLKQILIDVFALEKGADLVECNFSIVTTNPENLTVIQRLPHFDGTDPHRLALLHYCRDSDMGGTSFYRHNATGFETILDNRLSEYTDTLRTEINEIGVPAPGYFSGESNQFERIGQIEAKPNRMIIYRGISLHSGDISRPDRLNENPRSARLTINTFLAGRV